MLSTQQELHMGVLAKAWISSSQMGKSKKKKKKEKRVKLCIELFHLESKAKVANKCYGININKINITSQSKTEIKNKENLAWI